MLITLRHAIMGKKAYRAYGATFSNDNQTANKGSELTGASDSKLWTGSVWFRQTSASTRFVFSQSPTSTAGNHNRMIVNSDGSIGIEGQNAPDGGVMGLSITTATGVAPINVWNHFMWSFDRSDTAKRHVYINGVSDLTTISSYTDIANENTNGDFYIGNRGDNPSFFAWNGGIADLQIWYAYIDLSVQANRELFLSPSGRPANPLYAAKSSLGTPIIAQTNKQFDSWHTNQGSGGGFTVINGPLTSAGLVSR